MGTHEGKRILRTVGFATLGILLIWQVFSRSFVAYLADVAPRGALFFRSEQPVAALNLAETLLGLKRAMAENPQALLKLNVEHRDEIKGLVETTLRVDPLNAAGLRILGQLADADKEERLAWKFMQASAHLSVSESLAVYWLVQSNLAKPDYAVALYYADALLRMHPQLVEIVMPAFLLARNEDAILPLKKLLETNPPWRSRFFVTVPDMATDARVPLDLLLAVKDTPNPPTPQDIRSYVYFLINHNFLELAYYTWLQFLTPEQLQNAGQIFNGSFETFPSGLPFDWVLNSGDGFSYKILPRPDREDEHALFVKFEDGRVEFRSAIQLIMLSPGTYVFSFKYKGELLGPRGLKWRAVCAGKENTPLGETSMINGLNATWKEMEFTFAVPNTDCRGQYIRLDLDARMASEQFISGSVWFDDFQIARVTNPPKSQ